MWRLLRGRQLGGHKFRRQHEFGGYVLDFFCAAKRLAVEVDGGQHFSPEHAAHDEERTRFLEANGVRVLRFTNVDVLGSPDVVVEVIAAALE
jgi:very-short-patch-repair endonuclease